MSTKAYEWGSSTSLHPCPSSAALAGLNSNVGLDILHVLLILIQRLLNMVRLKTNGCYFPRRLKTTTGVYKLSANKFCLELKRNWFFLFPQNIPLSALVSRGNSLRYRGSHTSPMVHVSAMLWRFLSLFIEGENFFQYIPILLTIIELADANLDFVDCQFAFFDGRYHPSFSPIWPLYPKPYSNPTAYPNPKLFQKVEYSFW